MISLSAALLVALAGAPPAVVGSWTLLGQPFATFDVNGACNLEQQACSWRVNGSTLFITGEQETEAIPFSLSSNALTLTVNGIPVTLARKGSATSPLAAAGAAKTANGAGLMQLTDPLAKLLLSSAWCNFWFNKTSGYSGSARVQYFADGSYQLGKKSEGYSSGSGGTFASEARAGSSGSWYVKDGQMYGTSPPTDANPNPDVNTFYPLPVVVKNNSNGSPIITAAGKEYARCQ